MTNTESYYDWKLKLEKKPKSKEKKNNNKKEQTTLGISVNDFKRFIKLWRSKNIAF